MIVAPVFPIRSCINFSCFRDQQNDSLLHDGEITPSKQVRFSETISRIVMDDPDMEGPQFGRDSSVNWSSRNSPNTADDHVSSYSPSPLLFEEPSSSSSEGSNSTIRSLFYALKIAIH